MGKSSFDQALKEISAVKYTAADMRTAFMLGHSYGRQHIFNPQEMDAVKALEEATANWPD